MRAQWGQSSEQCGAVQHSQGLSTSQRRTDRLQANRRPNQTQSRQHMTSIVSINLDLWLMEHWKGHSVQIFFWNMYRHLYTSTSYILKSRHLLNFLCICLESLIQYSVLCVYCMILKLSRRLTRYHCWFHMGSSNSLSTGQSLHSLRDARLLRRFSYCCSAHSTCTHKTGSFNVLRWEMRWTELHRSESKDATHPIILRQLLGDVVGTSFHSARMFAMLEQEMVFQGPNLQRGRHERGWMFDGKWHNTSHLVTKGCRAGLKTSLFLTKASATNTKQFAHSERELFITSLKRYIWYWISIPPVTTNHTCFQMSNISYLWYSVCILIM